MPRVPSVTHRYTRVPQSARRMEVHAGTLGYVGINGEDGRVCAPGGRQRTDSLRGFPAGNAGDTGGSESPPGPTRPHPGPGGVSPPDPLAEALAPSAAQRACIRLAAETQRRYPDWAVTWGPGGYAASDDGHAALGPVTTQPALEALLHAETARRGRLAP